MRLPARTQTQLIARANLAGKPVITAAQILESRVSSRLPTRAGARGVAIASLDGTDCVMRSAASVRDRRPVQGESLEEEGIAP
jgi:pyruvate kinase